jgi:hypothetical protein
MAATEPAAQAARLARLNARLTAALDRLDALRAAPADAGRRRVWAEINALRKAVAPLLDWDGAAPPGAAPPGGR